MSPPLEVRFPWSMRLVEIDGYVRIATPDDDRWVWDLSPAEAKVLGATLMAFSDAIAKHV